MANPQKKLFPVGTVSFFQWLSLSLYLVPGHFDEQAAPAQASFHFTGKECLVDEALRELSDHPAELFPACGDLDCVPAVITLYCLAFG